MTPEPARPGGGPFNACDYLLDRHIRAGRGDRLALTGIAGDVSYAELAERVGCVAGGLRGLGLQAEQRVVMVMADSPEFVVVYLAAMRIGAMPVPISTMLRADGIAEIVADSKARIVAVSAQYLDLVAGALGHPDTGEVMAVVTDEEVRAVAGRATVALSRLPAGPGGYWSRYDASRQVFQGEWLRTGDTYVVDADGYYACLGRTGDMLKASGIWVAPAEVESRLLDHADVAQAVVVAAADTDGLEKPVAFVQLNPDGLADEETLIGFCRTGLPSFKRPRRIVFVTEYPTTATGKIRRVELRAQAAVILQAAQDAATRGSLT